MLPEEHLRLFSGLSIHTHTKSWLEQACSQEQVFLCGYRETPDFQVLADTCSAEKLTRKEIPGWEQIVVSVGTHMGH